MRKMLLIFFLPFFVFSFSNITTGMADGLRVGKVTTGELLKISPVFNDCQEKLDGYKAMIEKELKVKYEEIKNLEKELELFKENSVGRKEIEDRVVKKMLEADSETILAKRKISQKAAEFEKEVFSSVVNFIRLVAEKDDIDIFYDDKTFDIIWASSKVEKLMKEAPDFTEKIKELIFNKK